MDDPHITRHITYLKRRNAQGTTIAHRRGQLQRVSAYFDRPLIELTATDLDEWQASLRVCASSVRTYSSHVRAFYEWAHEAGLIEEDPALKLIMPKIKKRLPRPIPEKDLVIALATAAVNLQLYCWFLLAGYCGLRAGEIALVARSDFREHDNGGAFLTVHGKGGKERVVRVPPDVFDELKPFMHRQGAIFRRDSGLAFTSNDITRKASAHLHGVGLAYTIHTLRHRFATRLCDLGADPRDVQQALGHESLDTTMIYMQWNVRRSSSKVDKLSHGLKVMKRRQAETRRSRVEQ